MNNLKKIAFAAAVLSASFAAQAQEINPSWYIQPSIAALKPDSDFTVDKTAPAAGLKFGKAIDPHWDIQLGTTYGRSRDNGQRYQQNTLGVDALYLFSRNSFRPFFLVGAGAERDKLNTFAGGEMKKTSPYASLGVGFQADINDRWAVQVDARDLHGFIRGDEFPTSKSNNYYITVGLNFALGAKPQPAPAPVMEQAPPPPEPVAPPPPPPPPAKFEKVTLSSTETFAFDSAKLNPSQPKLDEIASALNAAPDVRDITITGYADRLGSEKYNQKLSEERANSVKAYLVGHGIDSSRLNAVGKGESNPVVECGDKKMKRAALIKCLEPNRRVEVEQITIERRVQ